MLAFAAVLPRPAISKVDPRMSVVDPVVCVDRSYQVQLRGVDNAPSAGIIVLDFSGTSVRLAATQEAGTTVDCAARTLSRVAGAFGTPDYGRATFHPRFGGTSINAAVVVSGDGIMIAAVRARSTDLDAANGTDLHDLVLFSDAFLHEPSAHPEMDFDGTDGSATLGDLVVLARAFLTGTKGPYCP